MLRFSRGGRPPKTGGAARPVSDQVVTLKQFGITKTQSSQWQMLAKIPHGEFEETARGVPRRWRKANNCWTYPHMVPRTRQAAPGKSGTHAGGATQGRLGGDPSQAGARRSLSDFIAVHGRSWAKRRHHFGLDWVDHFRFSWTVPCHF